MRTEIGRTVARMTLLLGLMGFARVSALASGPGTQPDPNGPGAVIRIGSFEAPGPQPQLDGKGLSHGIQEGGR